MLFFSRSRNDGVTAQDQTRPAYASSSPYRQIRSRPPALARYRALSARATSSAPEQPSSRRATATPMLTVTYEAVSYTHLTLPTT